MSTPGELPGQFTSFVGREADLALVSSRLAEDRLVSLIGPGGCGKTRLAIEVARQVSPVRSGGVCFADLSGLSDPVLVPSTVSSVFKSREAPGQDPVEVLVSHLDGQEVLLVLDNCEHLVGACAALADAVVRACPRTWVLATSREPLGVTGEATVAIGGLTLPTSTKRASEETLAQSEAGQLFVDRARRACPNLALGDAGAQAIAEICLRLDGIPLALELAAARARLMSVEAIAEGLSDRFRLLVGSGRTGPARQKTLLASIEWSTGLLKADERALLYRLAVFASGFTLPAAEAVCAGDGVCGDDVLALLSALVDKSLVQADPGTRRFRLHETMRAYAAAALEAQVAMARTRDRHLRYFSGLARDTEPNSLTYRTAEVASLLPLEADLDNMRSALDWAVESGQFDAGAELMGTAANLFSLRSRWTEASARCQALLAADLSPLRRVDVLSFATDCTSYFDAPEALRLAEELTALGRSLGDATISARGLVNEAAALMLGEPRRALIALDEALPLARRLGQRELLVNGSWFKSLAYERLNRPGEALTSAREAVQTAEEAGWVFGTMRARANVALQAVWAGQLQLAQSEAEVVLSFAEEASHPLLTVLAEFALAEVAYHRGDRQGAEAVERAHAVAMTAGDLLNVAYAETIKGQALICFGQEVEGYEILEGGTAKLEAFGFRRAHAHYRAVLAESALRRGDTATARRQLAVYVNDAAEREDPWCAPGLRAQARLARAERDTYRAHALACEGLALACSSGSLLNAIDLLELTAVTYADLGRHTESARLLGAADHQRGVVGYMRPAPARDELVPVWMGARTALGPEAFERAMADGRSLSFEDAVAYGRRRRAKHSRAVSGWASLTPTERRVVEMVAEHLTNAEIAKQMFVSTGTVKSHLNRVFPKLGVQDRRQLATLVAQQAGLDGPQASPQSAR